MYVYIYVTAYSIRYDALIAKLMLPSFYVLFFKIQTELMNKGLANMAVLCRTVTESYPTVMLEVIEIKPISFEIK